MATGLRLIGIAVVLATMLDDFLTVLYARSGVGVFTSLLNRAVWRLFSGLASPLPENARSPSAGPAPLGVARALPC